MKTKFRIATLAAVVSATATVVPDASAQQLEEVVVTAQRRAENMQEVAIAVTSLSGDKMDTARVFNVENIKAVSPSITFNKSNIASSTANIQIRGIGTTGNARTFEGAVGVFIDGIYRSRSGAALSQFLDIEQLQVLRGPQGTLFGKNTAAGALLLDSVTPSMDDVSGKVSAEVGNYDQYLVRGVINTPLGDRAALRLAGVKTERDGYFEDTTGKSIDNQDNYGLKGQLVFQATDTLELKLIADIAKSDDDCCYATSDEVDGPLQPVIDAFTAANDFGVPSKDRSDFEAVVNPETINKTEDSGWAFYANWDTGFGDLKYIYANRSYEVEQLQDADFSGADIMDLDERFKSDFRSHELTFAGQIESGLEANYLVGVFYSTEDLDMGRDLRHGSQAQIYWDTVFGAQGAPAGLANAAPGQLSAEVMEGSADSIALFTHWDITLSENFSLILGARYTEDEKEGSFTQTYFRDPLFDPLALSGASPGIDYDESFDDSSVSGTITLQYFASKDLMWYAGYNRGYKAGGVNIDSSAAGLPGSLITGIPADIGSPLYAPETIDSYEIGFKMDWMDGRARTNGAIFYNDIKDLQVAQFLGLIFNIENAPEGEVTGLELEGQFQLTDTLELSGGVTWLPTAEYGADASLLHLSGRDFPNAPEWAANLALTGNHSMASSLELFYRTELLYRGDVFTEGANNETQDALALVNASIGIGSDSGWRATAYVQNLTNEDYVTLHFNTPLQGDDRNGYVGAPRTYGVSISYEF